MRVVKSQLAHCLALFDVMADARASYRLTDLALRLDMPKSSTQRLLDHLIAEGWVTQDSGTGQYALSLRLAVLGQRFMQTAGITDACQSILDQAARDTRELVRLTVVDQNRLVWIASAQGAPAGLVYQPSMGGRIVSYATANGKVWLSTLSDEEACAIALADGLGRADAATGPKAIRTIEALLAELAAVRARGHATAQEEGEAGIAALAVAITDPGDGRTLGTTSVAAPMQRLPAARQQAALTVLKAAAAELARVWPFSRPARIIREAQR